MGRSKFRKIHFGSYDKCFLCDYEVRNNKRAMKLHFKYSHPDEEWDLRGKKDRNRCNICKKEVCLQH